MERKPQPESDQPLDPVEVSWQDLIDFAVGNASNDVAERVKQALNDPNHPLSYLKERGAVDDRSEEGSDA